MARNFPNFLETYMEYASDGFCPDLFHYWTGVSVLAGALERKVWISWSDSWQIYPNLYIFLVSTPGVGKSSAGNKGVTELLRRFDTMNFIPSQVTEARMIAIMGGARREFPYAGGKNVQSAAYLYASEASNSLKPIYGDLKSCFTDWYDCNRLWDKGTQMDGETKIHNVCFNMLAGCTFDYLSELIPEREIMGGFASRLLYIIHDEKMQRVPTWGASTEPDLKLKKALFEDLTEIHNLVGRFTASPGFQELYIKWFAEHDKNLQSMESERLQAFSARKHVNVIKLAMIQSVSQSNQLILKEDHWEAALALVDKLEEKVPKILNLSAGKDNGSQAAIVSLINEELRKAGAKGVRTKNLRDTLFTAGFEPQKFDGALNYMGRSKLILNTIIKGEPRCIAPQESNRDD